MGSRQFSTDEVARATGLTLRQLQFMVARGYVNVEQNGHTRLWGERDLYVATWIAEFRRRRVQTRTAAYLVRHHSRTELREIVAAMDLLRKAGLR